MFCKNRTPVLKPLFNKVVGPHYSNFNKERLLPRCFSVNIAKFLRTPSLKNICERLLVLRPMFPSHRKPVDCPVIRIGTTALTQLTLCVACFFVYLKRTNGGRGNLLPKSVNSEKVWSWNLRQWFSCIRNNDRWGHWFGQVTNACSADQNLIFDDVSLNKKWLGC